MNESDFAARVNAALMYANIGAISRYECEQLINDARASIGLMPLAHTHTPYGGVTDKQGMAECPSCKTPLVVELLGEPDEAGAYMVSCLCPACGFELESYTPRKLRPDDPSLGNFFKRILG